MVWFCNYYGLELTAFVWGKCCISHHRDFSQLVPLRTTKWIIMSVVWQICRTSLQVFSCDMTITPNPLDNPDIAAITQTNLANKAWLVNTLLVSAAHLEIITCGAFVGL